jgi:hypothetical protein
MPIDDFTDLKRDDEYSGTQSPLERAIIMAALFAWMIFALPPAVVEMVNDVLDFFGEWTNYGQVVAEWWYGGNANGGLLIYVILPFLGALGGLYYSGFRRDLPADRRFGFFSVMATLVYGGLMTAGFVGFLVFMFIGGKIGAGGDEWQLHG